MSNRAMRATLTLDGIEMERAINLAAAEICRREMAHIRAEARWWRAAAYISLLIAGAAIVLSVVGGAR